VHLHPLSIQDHSLRSPSSNTLPGYIHTHFHAHRQPTHRNLTTHHIPNNKMRKSTSLTATLLSLIGLSSQQQQTSSWGQPFTVDNAATSSQELLLPASTSNGIPVPLPAQSSAVTPSQATPSPSLPGIQSRVGGSAISSFSVSLATPTGSAGTVSTPLGGSGTSAGASAAQSSGAAVGMKKMGVAGVLAGAAGVMMI
jgi:hypothetical protein